MPNYEMVGVRFNMDKEEKYLFNNLKPSNRAGHIKEILKDVFNFNVDFARKSYIEGLIREIIKDMDYNMDIKDDLKNNNDEIIDENYLISAVNSVMRGV